MAPPRGGPEPGEEGAAHAFPPDLHDVRHLRLKALLLTVWALTSFGVCYFARDLRFSVGDWPVGFWMASQGAVFVFIGIVVAYAWAMSRFERQDALAAETSARTADRSGEDDLG